MRFLYQNGQIAWEHNAGGLSVTYSNNGQLLSEYYLDKKGNAFGERIDFEVDEEKRLAFLSLKIDGTEI